MPSDGLAASAREEQERGDSWPAQAGFVLPTTSGSPFLTPQPGNAVWLGEAKDLNKSFEASSHRSIKTHPLDFFSWGRQGQPPSWAPCIPPAPKGDG